jgi:hypothetical protein
MLQVSHRSSANDFRTISASSKGDAMNKLKLQHGVSRIRRAKLQSSIDQTIADDIGLMAKWSNNETQYIVNELLRFAIAQEEEFLKYKAGIETNSPRTTGNGKQERLPNGRPSETAIRPAINSIANS